jgi:oligopeptide transport system permease protein
MSLGILATLSFLLLRFLPGSPFLDEQALNPLVKEHLNTHWGLHQTVLAQLGHYLLGLLQGDLGLSMVDPTQSVQELIRLSFSQSFILVLGAFLFSVIGAILLSLISQRFQKSLLFDQTMIALQALPSLFLAPLLIYFFGFYLNILPVAFLSSPAHYILPILALALRPMALLVRILKTSLRQNAQQEFVRTAKAKGVGPTQILFKHILRNSWIPFLNYLGPLAMTLLSGSFLIEILFAIPGTGSAFVQALSERDYTVITGLALCYGVILIMTNILSEILIKVADPRLRESA